ncbi:IS1182 family transposase [Pontibacter qinzhouensis]|uniref:IS1182 family transposase n=1 Tax=Pontibacter qinzhouensis TaxID=2603253 RepID=A0A5C8IYZ7_9BACT|nr:IS1182 family transposase [Pontibacter qinzhouensis]TXK26419.1 IS1182 family transposase [Pontibacter qinzhouensis]
MKHFQGAMRDQGMLLPYNLEDWLPESHLARFVADIVEQLEMSSVYRHYQGKGKAAYDPRLLLSLLFYGYATGVFSSRKLEAATYDSVAFRFLAGNLHPDHDTIAAFRKRFLPQIRGWFKDILLLGKEMGLVRLGNIFIDGTKIQANASRHKAMSYEYMKRLEAELEAEIDKLLALAQAQDEQEKHLQLDIPQELLRRKERLEKIKQAKQVVEARAAERHERERQEYEQKLERRREQQEQTGRKPRGKAPKEPESTPKESDQYNFTDPESRIMKTSRGFEQCYNGQAAVNEDMLIVGAYSNAHANDRQEFIPAIASVPGELGTITAAVADTGYFSEKNVEAAQALRDGDGIEALIATGRERHNSFLATALRQEQEPGPEGTATESMRRRLSSKEGRRIYSKRKQTVEPVFGIIKEVLGFRRFSLRGEQQAAGEWSLVCLAYNLKRLFTLSIA